MGILCLCQQWSNMFKSLLATALVVAVKAEADPFYGYYGALPYAHGYAVAGVPFGSPSGLDPITQGLDPVTQGALPVAHYYGKRSADAEADPYYLGGYAVAGLPLDTHLARTPSLRALMLPPRDTLPTPMATLATTTVKFRELTRRVC